MANSRVNIINLALTLLGAARVGAPDEEGENAEALTFCYDNIRDSEQRANIWHFTRKRAILAPSSVVPAFGYGYAFPLPTNCLRVIKPSLTTVDWSIEQHENTPSILTNDGNVIQLRFVERVMDETKFDPLFTMMFACSLAWWCCERLTQSNSKRDAIERRYTASRLQAYKTNAFERVPLQSPPDEWLTAMSNGGLADSSWSQE